MQTFYINYIVMLYTREYKLPLYTSVIVLYNTKKRNSNTLNCVPLIHAWTIVFHLIEL